MLKAGKNIRIFQISLVLALALCTAAFSRPMYQPSPPTGNNGPQLAPKPSTVDQIIHNVGNIATTVDNWGYIGGYMFYGLPSGEWPRGSGHDYLAEVRYWIGGVNSVGDTIVANSYDDFQALETDSTAANPYMILLSTDTSRYLSYDPSDTVGFGFGNPASGWRIWDADSNSFIYNRVYNSLSASFFPGGPTSLQDSHYRLGDAASGTSVLGLELTHTILQWNYCYNEDFMFVLLEITNTSSTTYDSLAFGLYIDIDVGGPDGSGENGRLEDLVAFDSLENLAWIYDNLGVDPGWGPTTQTGILGTKLLETPNNIGMTAFRTDDWAFLPNTDPGRYTMINSAQFDVSLPPTDQFYIQCVNGISMTPGQTVRVVYAIIAGADEADFRDNASLAQSLYDANFIGPQPPATPLISARAADEKVYLFWNDTAEVSTDPLTGIQDFVGYKLYRSDNQGKTWGVTDYNTGNSCLTLDYAPLSTYTVLNPGDPIQHSYIDTGLFNGVEYWYCLAAFDEGDTVTGVEPLQSGFGQPGINQNVIRVTPTTDPAGFYDAVSTVEHNYSGTGLPSDGTVSPLIFDAGALNGSNYQVVFEDRPEKTYWHLINMTSNDTVLANQTKTTVDPGLYEVAEGMRVVVRDGDHDPRGWGQTMLGGADTNLVMGPFYGPTLPAFTGDDNDVFGNQHFSSTFELRYTGDSTRANWVLDGFYGSDNIFWVPFEAWNTTTNERISLAVYDFDVNDLWDPYDLLAIVNYPYDSVTSVTSFAFPNNYSWLFAFDDTLYNPVVGDVFEIQGAPLNNSSDNFTFTADGINAGAAANELDDIRVVPNPYIAQYSAMVEIAEGESVLEFQNLPQECTIRIYNLSGGLVQTLVHNDNTGSERWNLMSTSRQQIASGTYIFHVESPFGEHMGRFAIIK